MRLNQQAPNHRTLVEASGNVWKFSVVFRYLWQFRNHSTKSLTNYKNVSNTCRDLKHFLGFLVVCVGYFKLKFILNDSGIFKILQKCFWHLLNFIVMFGKFSVVLRTISVVFRVLWHFQINSKSLWQTLKK